VRATVASGASRGGQARQNNDDTEVMFIREIPITRNGSRVLVGHLIDHNGPEVWVAIQTHALLRDNNFRFVVFKSLTHYGKGNVRLEEIVWVEEAWKFAYRT